MALVQCASDARKNVPTALDGSIKELFHKASVELQDPAQTNDARVHGTRKCLKKLRALSPLLTAMERERLSSADRFALRMVARSLGRVRAPAGRLLFDSRLRSTSNRRAAARAAARASDGDGPANTAQRARSSWPRATSQQTHRSRGLGRGVRSRRSLEKPAPRVSQGAPGDATRPGGAGLGAPARAPPGQ